MLKIERGSNAPLTLNRSVRICFGLITTLYMLSGAAELTAGGYFKATNKTSRRSVIISSSIENALLSVGSLVFASAVVGVIGALSPLSRKKWLLAYVWLIVLATLFETGIGIWMWTRTLDVNGIYSYNWRNVWPGVIKQMFQDHGHCCGYLNPLDSPADSCNSAFGCVVSVQKYTQGYLTYTYTCLFAFVFVDVAALLSALVLLTIRNDEERLRWSRANAIFRSLKKAESVATLYIPEPKPTHT
ncbi:Tetraspanin family-domain-containing protein [Coemansia mojavensis]|nr:Tetraspanin family-domain-containing protein [Coemansia mojavensis]KAJ1739206.1 hypothetical protein LPJ68_004893 [Coemansia sp. RSA 1086]